MKKYTSLAIVPIVVLLAVTAFSGVVRAQASSPSPTPAPIVIVNVAPSPIGQASVTLKGNITSIGGASVSKRGFQYITKAERDAGAIGYMALICESGSFGTGAYGLNTPGICNTTTYPALTCGTTYKYQAFANNSGGQGVSSPESEFTTAACNTAPVLAVPTAPSANITQTGALLSGNITSSGGASVTAYGFNYGTTASYGSVVPAPSPAPTPGFTGAYTQSISGLSCGTTYHFRSFAVNSIGTTNTADQTFTTDACPNTSPILAIPTAPSGGIYRGSATLSGEITSSGGASVTSYGFEYGTSASYGNTVLVPSPVPSPVPTPGFVGAYTQAISGLSCNTTYHFRAFATNSAGTTNTYPGNDTTFKTDACAAPSNLSLVVVSNSQIDLSWSDSDSGITGYKIYRCYGSGCGFGPYIVITPSGTGTSYSDTGLTASNKYYYTVSALDAAGIESVRSATSSATTLAAPDTTAPSTPSGTPTATVISSTQINLSWGISTDNVGIAGYKIYRCYGSGCGTGTYSFIATSTGTGLTYSDTTVLPSNTYRYKVSAFDAAGNVGSQSTNSSSVATPSGADTTAPTVPAPATITATAVSSSQINLTWAAATDNVGIAGYKIYRCLTSGCANTYIFIATSTGTGLTYSDTNLTPGTEYRYKISAYDTAGNESAQYSPFARATTATIFAPTITALPAASSITLDSAVLHLTITANGGSLLTSATGIKYRPTGTGSFTSVSLGYNPALNQDYTVNVTGLTCGTTYDYYAYTTNTGGLVGNSSPNSTFKTLKCQAIPVVTLVTPVSVSQTSQTLKATLTDAGGLTVTAFSFNLTDSYGQTSTVTGPFVEGTTYSATITSLTCNTTYHYRANAVNSKGTYSTDDDTFTTAVCTPPTISPTAATSSVTRTSIVLTGNVLTAGNQATYERGFDYAVANTDYTAATSETIAVSGSQPSPTPTPSATTGNFSATLTNLIPGTLYKFRAYASNSGGKVTSNEYFFRTNASPTALHGWAWSPNIGWINLETIQIHETTGDLTGSAWSPNIGWVKFGGLSGFPSTGSPDGDAKMNWDTGAITGWIRACGGTLGTKFDFTTGGITYDGATCTSMDSRTDGWDGWIELSGVNHLAVGNGSMLAQAGATYTGVKMNLQTEQITGMAWGGPVVGWVGFNADIKPVAFAATCSGSSDLAGNVRFVANAIGGSQNYQYKWNNSGTYTTSPYLDYPFVNTTPITNTKVSVKDTVSGTILSDISCPSPVVPVRKGEITVTGAGCTIDPNVTSVLDGDKVTFSLSSEPTIDGHSGTFSYIWNTGIGNSPSSPPNARTFEVTYPPGAEMVAYAISVKITEASGINTTLPCGSGRLTVINPETALTLGIGTTVANANDTVATVKLGQKFVLKWLNSLPVFDEELNPRGYRCSAITPVISGNKWEIGWDDEDVVSNPLYKNTDGIVAPYTGKYTFTVKCDQQDPYKGSQSKSVDLKVVSASEGEI